MLAAPCNALPTLVERFLGTPERQRLRATKSEQTVARLNCIGGLAQQRGSFSRGQAGRVRDDRLGQCDRQFAVNVTALRFVGTEGGTESPNRLAAILPDGTCVVARAQARRRSQHRAVPAVGPSRFHIRPDDRRRPRPHHVLGTEKNRS